MASSKGIILMAPDITLGADPEVFIRKGTRIIGSELAIPEQGVGLDGTDISPLAIRDGYLPLVVRDGVQAELHPSPNSCRQSMAYSMAGAMIALNNRVKALGPDCKIDLTQVVTVRRDELAKLSDKSRILGCAPSLNIYGTPQLEAPPDLRIRAAGGHIHIGCTQIVNGHIDTTKLVMALDVLCGLPMVLVDRNRRGALRRKFYGRAGEYRLPKYGLEYRTLSNFWLRSYTLWSLASAQVRIATRVAFTDSANAKKLATQYGYSPSYGHTWDAFQQLMDGIKLVEVQEAINTNNFAKAHTLYMEKVRPFLARLETTDGIGSSNVNEFDYFVAKGVDHWFDKDPVNRWLRHSSNPSYGWEAFASNIVRPQLKKSKLTTDGSPSKPATVNIRDMREPRVTVEQANYNINTGTPIMAPSAYSAY